MVNAVNRFFTAAKLPSVGLRLNASKSESWLGLQRERHTFCKQACFSIQQIPSVRTIIIDRGDTRDTTSGWVTNALQTTPLNTGIVSAESSLCATIHWDSTCIFWFVSIDIEFACWVLLLVCGNSISELWGAWLCKAFPFFLSLILLDIFA